MRNALIAGFVALQIALPLSYYLGDDPYDERFAWRMFSPVRLARCTLQAFDETDGVRRPMRLGEDLHVVWINLMKRARRQVIDHWAFDWCAEQRAAGREPVLRVQLTCASPEAAGLGVCRDPGDRNGDGVPDGYVGHPACAGDRADCFARDCGDMDAAACHEARCLRRPIAPDADLCAGGAR
ncbi:MAG: hypothetical protein H6704_21940 [Myxococcales bacterium]|nr:hypothetical protein [Myxococcales bacterium]